MLIHYLVTSIARIEQRIFRLDLGSPKNINKYEERERFLYSNCTHLTHKLYIIYIHIHILFLCKKSSIFANVFFWPTLSDDECRQIDTTRSHMNTRPCIRVSVWFTNEMILKMYILLALSYFRTSHQLHLFRSFVFVIFVPHFFFFSLQLLTLLLLYKMTNYRRNS